MESLSTFHQELDLSTATIILKLGNAQNQISFNIWADIENNVIHVEASSKIPYTITRKKICLLFFIHSFFFFQQT